MSRGRRPARPPRAARATSRSGTARAAGAPGRSPRRSPSARPSNGRVASIPTLMSMQIAERERAYVRVAGTEAEDYLQRMVSNDVEALAEGESCSALLLTPKARVIAPVVVLRRGPEDFLLLTEAELGEPLRAHLVRMRMRARCEIEPEQHSSTLVFGGEGGIPTREFGEPAAELIDADLEPTL